MPELVSVIILTLNEELFVERAVKSASWADEIVVLDSGSSDRTTEIASRLGAAVYHQTWLGWSGQREKAISLAKNDWVFILECDEIITAKLARSIADSMRNGPDDRDGYVVDRRDEFMGELMFNLRRPAQKRTFVRLFNRKSSRYDMSMLIHEKVIIPGSYVALDGFLLHWRNSNLDKIFETHNRNANIESQELMKSGRGGSFISVIVMPILRFAWVYLRCGHWRKGTRGLILAGTHSLSEFIRQAKTWERRHQTVVLNPPSELTADGDT
jgi:(heptosyl)LPS beta-1,4-glucosyltransferase